MVSIDQVLSTATDIVPIKDLGEDRWAFAVPLQGEIAKHYFKQSISNPNHANVLGFQGYWNFKKELQQIRGSSTFLNLRLDTKMRPDGFWLPGFVDLRVLEEKGKLTSSVYRDVGVVVYNDGEPNQLIASNLIKQVKEDQLPLLLPFRALDYKVDGECLNGIAIDLTQNQKGIIFGEEARKIIEKIDYPGNSGAGRVSRYRGGDWIANWARFIDYSDDHGLVDWMCAEGARADLVSAHTGMISRQYDSKIERLETKKSQEQEAFEKSLS